MSSSANRYRAICVGLIGSLMATSSSGAAAGGAETVTAAQSVTIMTFNVENLFDNVDDPSKNDETFLALADKQSAAHKTKCAKIAVERWRKQCLDWDWNDAILEKKLAVIAAAILQTDHGRGPDILALQEVENLGILERLRTEYLGEAGYLPAILIEGHDIRGIDVAFLSRLPLAEDPRLHAFPHEGIDDARRGDTRGILEATFILPGGALLSGYAVHFPAPFHPTEMRVAAYQQLNEIRQTLPDDRYVFAAGDFNTTSREDTEKNMLQRFVRPFWRAVHEQGCDNCRGTQYYARDKSWSYLDMILWSPAMTRGTNTTWSIRAASFAIANQGPGQLLDNGTPARFEMPEGSGVSDHWPVVFTIELK